MPAIPKTLLSFASRASPADENTPRLYCLAYAGGSSSTYGAWARALAPALNVIGVEMPGHTSRFQEVPFETVHEMAEEAAVAIESAQKEVAPNRSYALYGHSLGAIVAFEAVKLLQDRNPALEHATGPHLFVGAARAPHLPRVVPRISHLPKIEFLHAVQQRYGGLPAVLFEEPEFLEMVLPALRADFSAYESYACPESAKVRSPITAFYGTGDPVVGRAAVNEWSRVTTGGFLLQPVDGDHFFLNNSRDLMLNIIRQSFEYGELDDAALSSNLSTTR